MSDYSLSLNEAGGATPFEVQTASGQDIDLRSVYAEWDGSGAGGSFLAALTILTPSGVIVSRTRPDQIFAAGDTGVVTYAPFLGRHSVTTPTAGAVLAFSVANRSGADFWDDIYLVPTATGAATRLTFNTPDNFYDHPVLSPDGASIVFLYSTSVITSHLYAMDVDGSNVTALVTGQCSEPQWLDADTILYRNAAGDWLRINRDGTGGATLVSKVGLERGHPSPDGTQFAYTVRTGGVASLWVINADGTGDTQIVASTGANYLNGGPVWRTSGTRIMYAAGAGMNTINPDGTGATVEVAALPNGFWWNTGMMSDRFFFTNTATFGNWKMGQIVFGTGASLVSPTLSVFRAVQRGVAVVAAGRVFTVQDAAFMGGVASLVSILPDGSDLTDHFNPDESGAPLFQNVFLRG